ncbi:hypothetical protein ES708_21081 [subsurface metagenome]
MTVPEVHGFDTIPVGVPVTECRRIVPYAVPVYSNILEGCVFVEPNHQSVFVIDVEVQSGI